MQFSTLPLPILGGVIFCRTTTRFRYRLYRRKGYELFFLAATAGAILLGVSFLLTQLILFSEWGVQCYTIWNAFSPEVPYLGTSIVAFALGWTGHLLEWRDEYFGLKREIVLREVDEFGTEIELLLFQAVEDLSVLLNEADDATGESPQQRLPLFIVTLESGKVSIGVITPAPDPYGKRSYLKLVKIASGYRTKEHDVQVVTRYDDLLSETSSSNAEDFEVTVQLSSISYISPFDPDINRQGWPMKGQEAARTPFLRYYST